MSDGPVHEFDEVPEPQGAHPLELAHIHGEFRPDPALFREMVEMGRKGDERSRRLMRALELI